MAIAIKPKRSESSSSAPTASDLAVGEIAVNSADQKIYTKNSGGSVVVVGNANLVDDSSPQLGGNLDLNSNNITGTGDISVTGDITLTSTDSGSTNGPVLDLYRNSSSPSSGDYLGQVAYSGENSNGGTEIYAKVTGKITDPTLGSEDGLIETAIKGGGSFTIVSRQRSDELQLLNGVGLSVDGSLTASGLSYPTSDGTANQVLATDGSGTLSFVDGGGSASGENVSWSVTQSSHGFSAGDVIYNNGTSYAKAQANSASTLGLFVVSAVADVNNFTATLSGKITLSSLTAGQYYFLSSSTAGLLTTTEPTSGYSNPILFALTTTDAVVLPFRPAQIDTTLTTIAVADGGTGATTAAGARTNLDVYSTAEVNAQSLVFSIVMG